MRYRNMTSVRYHLEPLNNQVTELASQVADSICWQYFSFRKYVYLALHKDIRRLVYYLFNMAVNVSNCVVL